MSEQKEVRWFCEQCLEDQSTNIWDHYDRTRGKAVCPVCKAKGETNDKTVTSTGAAPLDNGNQRADVSDTLPELLQISDDLI